MIDSVLSLVAPHICVGCGTVGKLLCSRCFFDIIKQKWLKCIVCNQQITTAVFAKNGNSCPDCIQNLPFDKVFVVGERSGALQKLVGDYKYFSQRGGSRQIAALLSRVLPENMSDDFVIVPLSTIPKHIRQRGFDHMKLVAKCLAKIRRLKTHNILKRTNNLSQHGASERQRLQNAESAFVVDSKTTIPGKILLIDDIYTTGAITQTSAKLLKSRGVDEVWLAVVARQLGD